MIELTNIIKLYGFEAEVNSEKGLIEGVLMGKKWQTLSDEEKIIYRKDCLKIDLYYSNETEIEKLRNNYVQSIINTSELILSFLNSYEIRSVDNIKNNYMDRIFVMLYCELEFVNKYPAYKHINHIPYQIFENLLNNIDSSKLYQIYNLDSLFEEYKKMLELFDKKPFH